jgi:RNA polymerase sigma factor (sigma-70 family)
MADSDSAMSWLEALKRGDPVAAQRLWERYFGQLAHWARNRLSRAVCCMADEEDVALSALNSFCRGLQAGRFPQLSDPHNLWSVLVMLTARKVARLVKHETRLKRRNQRTQEGNAAPADIDLVPLVGREPTPDIAAQLAEECQRLHDSLPDDSLRVVMKAKLEGYTLEEIAALQGCTTRTVQRRLATIQALWRREFRDE